MLKGDDEKVNIVRTFFECHVLLKCDCPAPSLLRVIEHQNNSEVAKERTAERLPEFPELRVLLNSPLCSSFNYSFLSPVESFRDNKI
jgi:hypothetical protein